MYQRSRQTCASTYLRHQPTLLEWLAEAVALPAVHTATANVPVHVAVVVAAIGPGTAPVHAQIPIASATIRQCFHHEQIQKHHRKYDSLSHRRCVQ